MGHGFKSGGGGGAGINLKLATYPTEEELLLSIPAINTIGLETAVFMPGYIIDDARPETAEEGTVWIRIGSSGVSVNILKKNQIVLRLDGCSQFIQGEWIKLNAWLYQETGWAQFAKDWDGHYFLNGEQYEDITGGWVRKTTSGTVTIGETLSVLSSNASAPARVGTAKPVDLTDVTTLYYDSPSGRGGYVYGAYIRISLDENGSKDNAKDVNFSVAGIGSIDVSDLSGEYYLIIHTLGGSGGSGYGDIQAMWSE